MDFIEKWLDLNDTVSDIIFHLTRSEQFRTLWSFFCLTNFNLNWPMDAYIWLTEGKVIIYLNLFSFQLLFFFQQEYNYEEVHCSDSAQSLNIVEHYEEWKMVVKLLNFRHCYMHNLVTSLHLSKNCIALKFVKYLGF